MLTPDHFGNLRDRTRLARNGTVEDRAGPLAPHQRGEARNAPVVWILGAEKLVVHGAFDFAGVAGFAGEAQKLPVEVEPGHGGAAFSDACRFLTGEVLIVPE